MTDAIPSIAQLRTNLDAAKAVGDMDAIRAAIEELAEAEADLQEDSTFVPRRGRSSSKLAKTRHSSEEED